MSDEIERELVQLRALLASALGIRVDSNAAMLAATRRLRDEHEKWAAAIAETAVRLSDAGYHGQLVDSVGRLIAERDADRDSRFRWAEETAHLEAEVKRLRSSAVVLPEDACVNIGAFLIGAASSVRSGETWPEVAVRLLKLIRDEWGPWRPAAVEAAPPTAAEVRPRECTCGAGGMLARGHTRECLVRQRFESRELGPAIHGLGEPAYFCVDDAAGVSGTGTEASDGE